jgi:hypothetical protein
MSNNRKDIEKLRWEYLKRSEDYKEFSEAMASLEKKYSIIKGDSRFDPLKLLSPSQIDRILDASYLSKKNGYSEVPFFQLHGKYGNVHKKSFNECLKDKKPLPLIVKDFTDKIGSYIDAVARIYQNQNSGREPSIAELKEGLIDYMKIAFEGYVYLAIEQREFTYPEAEKLTEKVGKILKKKCPKKRFVKDELERYLAVYDMRIQEPPVTYRKIQEKLYPQTKYTNNTLRARINDFNKAKKNYR